MTIRRFAAAAGVLALLGAAPLAAQDFPAKSMTYIIPFNAGGESDISARFQQAEWEEVSGQSVVIQYQPGAGGAQAWSQLNTIPGDGYTIMGINLPHTILQPMEGGVSYATDDLTPVNYFHYTPHAIVVPADSPYQTLEDLVAYAKENPGLVTFAGSGTNSANNLAQAQFDEMAGITTTYIPFSGTSPSMTAVLGNQVTAGWSYSTAGINQGDQMRILAVASDERLDVIPDVPTFKELGYDLVGGAYRGVAVPASTPEDIRQAVSDIVSRINADPDFIKKMEEAGFVLTDVPYSEMSAFMDARKEEYGAVAEVLGIGK